jgi:hypothetical protein
MQRSKKSRHGLRCRDCRFRDSLGRCLDPVLEQGRKSGRCGDYVWFVRHGKQLRRVWVKPRDPRTPKQRRWRARLAAVSAAYSEQLTDAQQDACIAAGAKLRCRKRLGSSGDLTGHQYWVHKKLKGKTARRGQKAAGTTQVPHLQALTKNDISQVLQPQVLTRTTWGHHRGHMGSTPDPHRANAGLAGKGGEGGNEVECPGNKAGLASQVQRNQTLTLSTRAPNRRVTRATPSRIGLGTPSPAGDVPRAVAWPHQVYYTSCMKSNVITVRLRRPKAEIQAQARPNLNAWINQLIEQALVPRSAEQSAQKAAKEAKRRVARTSPAACRRTR